MANPTRSSWEGSADVFARLLLAAKEDPALRDHLRRLLALPEVHRRALINTALHEMALRGEAAALQAGFGALLTPGAAEAVLQFLEVQ